MGQRFRLLLWFICCLSPGVALALEPAEIAVVANSREPQGVALARFYMVRRHIPRENLLLLTTTRAEQCSRPIYDREIAVPLAAYLQKHPKLSCLLLFYGLPLRIQAEPAPKGSDHPRPQQDTVASLDSELSLVKVGDHPLPGWLANPYFLGFQHQHSTYRKGQVLMVARLDGPSPATVRRLIVDSLAVEGRGLQGTAYFDARWPRASAKKLQGYKLYDQSLHLAADIVGQALPTVLNEEEGLFQPGQAPQAALYCGWYSLAHYVDAFNWQPGAIAYHLASAECATLKQADSQVWCKRLLEEGVAATIGPVGEPYIQAFPLPQLFFSLLLDGDFNLVEAYQLSLPFISWKMILIGDPLYRPFKARGVLP